MTRLEATLDDIVGKLRENRFPNEQSISQGVVLRVLGDLNWDVYDPAVVVPEYKTGEGRADFALCDPPGGPLIYIEVKQPGGAERGVRQVLDYAFHTGGVPFVVLTDGKTWSVYLPMAQGKYEERRVCMLDLLERSTEESADILCRYLERSRVVSGDALRVAREEYQRHRRRATARMEIPNAWNSLVNKHERPLIDLLAGTVESKAGIRPNDTDVIDFLESLRQRTAANLTPTSDSRRGTSRPPPTDADTPNVTIPRDDTPTPVETAISTTKRRGRPSRWAGRIIRSTRAENPRTPGTAGWRAHNFIMNHPDGVSYENYRAAGYTPNHLDWDEKHGHIAVEEKDAPSPPDQRTNTPMLSSKSADISNVTGSRSVTLRILGENITCKNAMDAVVKTLNRLQERDRNFLANFAGDPRNIKRTRRFVSESVETLYTDPKYRKYHVELGDGWFLSTNYNNEYKRIILELAAKVAGLTFGPGQDIDVDFRSTLEN